MQPFEFSHSLGSVGTSIRLVQKQDRIVPKMAQNCAKNVPKLAQKRRQNREISIYSPIVKNNAQKMSIFSFQLPDGIFYKPQVAGQLQKDGRKNCDFT
jgi:pyruvate/2-oxoglutarate dehydrogenase complex dihydrolipoamide dehydrogenase (E3) component